MSAPTGPAAASAPAPATGCGAPPADGWCAAAGTPGTSHAFTRDGIHRGLSGGQSIVNRRGISRKRSGYRWR